MESVEKNGSRNSRLGAPYGLTRQSMFYDHGNQCFSKSKNLKRFQEKCDRGNPKYWVIVWYVLKFKGLMKISDIKYVSKNLFHALGVFFRFANNQIHVFGASLSLQKIKFMLFELFWACKKFKTCFLSFFELAKCSKHAFWAFLTLQKIIFMLFELF